MTDNALLELPVPSLQYEDHYWRVDTQRFVSRTKRSQETGPYKSSIPPRIARLSFNIPSSLSAEMEESARSLGEFDSYATAKFGDRHQIIDTMSAILLRAESSSSSQIENMTVQAKRLAMQEINEGSGGNAEIVVGNVRAMEAALEFAGDLTEHNLLRMHKVLLSAQHGYEAYAGVYRSDLVWINGGDFGPKGASYVGPQPELIADCMKDLFEFLERDDLPVLLQCAIAHAQLETIHPFADGNGRTGRALIHAIFRNKGITQNMTPPVSAGLLTNKDRYFSALETYREGNAAPIIEAFAYACRFAAGTGERLIDDLNSELEEAREMLHGLRTDAGAWKVLPWLIQQPVVNTDFLIDTVGLTPNTARRSMEVLVERGILSEGSGARRNRVWTHRGILDVLDEYAEQIRRMK